MHTAGEKGREIPRLATLRRTLDTPAQRAHVPPTDSVHLSSLLLLHRAAVNQRFFSHAKRRVSPAFVARSVRRGSYRVDLGICRPSRPHASPVHVTRRPRRNRLARSQEDPTMAAGEMNDFHQILTSLLSTDNDVRQRAEVTDVSALRIDCARGRAPHGPSLS